MRHFVLAMLAVCASAPAIAAPAATPAGTRDFAVADHPSLDDVYPDRVTQWPGGVTSLADVTYSTLAGYRPMVVDIYMPPQGTAPKPLVLFVHGGGWVSGHTRHSGALSNFPSVLARLAGEGFVVASLEYRLSAEARFPAQVQDARAALRFLKSHAARYGIDPARTGVWGGSAGGHLAALTAMTCGVTSLDAPGTKSAPGSECVQSAAIWYGVFDFGALAATRPGGGDGAAERLLGCTGPCTPAQFGAASPNAYITPKAPPFLLIHGLADKTVPVQQSQGAEAALKAAGVPVRAIYIPGADHSFIGASPQATREATLMATNATFDFLHDSHDGAAK